MVTETFPPEVNGVAMTLGRIVEGLLHRGHAVQVIRPRQTREAGSARVGLDEVLSKGLPLPAYGELRFGLPAKNRLAKLWAEKRPDIVHVVTEGPLGWSAVAAARKLQLPITSSFHTNFHSYSQHYGMGLLKKPIETYLRKLHNRTQATMVPTRAMQLDLQARGYSNVTLLSRGVSTDMFSPAKRSAALRAAWDVAPGVRLRGAGYVGYRLPTLAELYRPFRVGADATAPNADLSPERLRGVEAGVDLDPLPGLRLTATVFANRLNDAIANVTLGHGPATFPQVGFVAAGASFNQRQNLTAIVAQGVETEAHAALGRWRLDASYAYTHARDRASGVSAALNGLRPAQTPEHQASATVSVTPFEGALLAVTGRYVGGQSEDDLGTRRLTQAATMDAVAEVPVGHGVRLILRAENLTDATVQTAISAAGVVTVGQPRTLWAGVRVGL